MINPDIQSKSLIKSDNATTLAIVIIAAIVPSLLLMGPVVASQLATERHMTPSAIGLLFMAENGAMSLATLPALFWLSRYNLKTISLFFGAVFILANLASMSVDSATSLIITRVISGVAGGSLMVICMTSASMLPKPDRAYGLWIFGQLGLGALGLSILPSLFQEFGLKVFFLAMAILMLICLPLTRLLPATITKGHPESDAPSRISRRAIIGLIAILLFYISLMGVWTFIGSIASSIGMDSQTSGNVLAIATLFGIAGAGVATLLGGRRRYTWLLIVGYGLMMLGIIILLSPNSTMFSLAAFSFKFAWTFSLPFILATLSKLDRNGQVMNLSNLVIGGGIAIGPMVAGLMIEKFGGFHSVLIFALVLAFTSLLLTLYLQPKTQ